MTERRRMRTVLVYAQDNNGLGHVNRTLTIVRHILAVHPHVTATIVTKSPITSIFALPERCDYVKMPTGPKIPAVAEHTEEERASLKLRRRAMRSQLLRDVALGLLPDVVLVDNEPLGVHGEFRDGLYALKERWPSARFVYGMRDIMDDPQRTRTLWHELGVYQALEELYDEIAVYGTPQLYDVAAAYGFSPTVQAKLHYCGHIVRDTRPIDAATVRQQYGLPSSGPLVVATVGGGSDGYPVLATTLAALQQLRAQYPTLCAILVTGPFMPAQQRAVLQEQAAGNWTVVPQADNFQLIAAADAIVGMGGYNSVCEALTVARPLVIVPRATHKLEQTIRAEVLAARDLARCVHPAALSPETLSRALQWALSRDQAEYVQRVRQVMPPLNGVAELTASLTPWLTDSWANAVNQPAQSGRQ
jgi:predicted glycosyltransferase